QRTLGGDCNPLDAGSNCTSKPQDVPVPHAADGYYKWLIITDYGYDLAEANEYNNASCSSSWIYIE
ncbi:MAG: hypothetical protein JRI25_23830, partial [Deltaproteobacteria bacterium]|nr:hypothetical protein [Deltaproteobacteria bacterium]